MEPPVARCDIYELPELAGHQFVTAHIGTNFPLTPGQAGAIERLIAAPRAVGDPAPADNRSRRTRLAAPKPRAQSAEPAAEHSLGPLEALIASDLDQIEPGLTLIGLYMTRAPPAEPICFAAPQLATSWWWNSSGAA